MDPTIKSRWLKALRSGRYRQGKEYLCQGARSHPEFCCLGVLAKIQGAKFDDDGHPVLNGEACVRAENPASYLPPRLAAGVHLKTQKVLGNMNDGEHRFIGIPKTFKQIANYIEKHL